jgi:predicted O-linked N-acetylglucosamine transferase (SPINDLY family)
MLEALFSDAMKQAVTKGLSARDLLAVVEKLTAAREFSLIAALYDVWTKHNGDDPLLAAMHFNHGVILSGMGDLAGAKVALEQAIKVAPDFIPPYINLGTLLEKLGAAGNAVQLWYLAESKLRAVSGDTVNYKLTLLKQIGRVLEGGYLDEEAEGALRLALEIDPGQWDVAQHWISLRQRQCKWPVVSPWNNVSRDKLMANISPLSLAGHTDDPFLQLASGHSFSKNHIERPGKTFVGTHKKLKEKGDVARLRVGYLSSDLREHAVGFLSSEIFELHDRQKVEVFAYYCGHKVADDVQSRIKAAVDHWTDISEMTDEQAAQKMVDDEIAILIDFNGYTHSARTRVLAMRPAPIIVNWLGFPATMGTPYHNYIIADEYIVPRGNEIHFSEKVLRLPCYQPNDRKRVVSDSRPSRKEAGLPENAVVFCSFNGAQKITPSTWKLWMDILQGVPNSVLWQLGNIALTEERLREAARSHGIDPARIIFAPKMRNPEHLARYPLADLFLDTSPYGAHTTASDAMWMGVPIVTLSGCSFASRVCGSLATAAGIGDLVCNTFDEYVTLAVALGNDKARRETYRKRLMESRDTCVLFDTPLLVSSVEALYAEMWRDFVEGRLHRPDLSNLDVYHRIGIGLDAEDMGARSAEEYSKLYLTALKQEDEVCFIAEDGRLWNAQDR